MKNKLLESQLENIHENTSVSSAEYASLVLPLVKKIYGKSLISQIADIQPTKSPIAKVAALYSLYSGDGNSAENNTHIDNSYIIVVDNTTGLSIDDIITIGTSTFKIHYIEDLKLLISRETDTYIPVKTDTFSGKTISYASMNRASIKKLFKNYTGSYAYGNDDNNRVNYLGFETRTETVNTVARKIRTKYSQEQMQDIFAVYKEKMIDLVTESMANEVRYETDKELIRYMKFIAQLTSNPIVLTNSYGSFKSGSLADVSYDIVANIYLAAEKIVKDTKRNRTVFVLADPVTSAFLQTNAFHTSVDPEEGNPYKIGKLGIYPLYVDLFAEPSEHYVIVGYMGSSEQDGDSGIIYSPYTSQIVTATDTNFKENVIIIDRYAIIRHPQDSGNVVRDDAWNIANEGNSDFFKMFLIDYATTNADSPNGLSNFNTSALKFE